MSSYRFCRSDDLPVLVEAYNACFVPHFAHRRAVEVGDLKRWSRELDLWTSSCMIAASDEGPLAVLLAAKRETESLVLALGVRSGHERQGHGRHLLESLQQKMSILGPPALRVELPGDWRGVRAFFDACGWEERFRARDFVLEPSASAETPSPLLGPATVDELDRLGALEGRCAERVSWWRSTETLRRRAAQIAGLAAASDERLEAFALYSEPAEPGGPRDVWALGVTDRAFEEPMVRLLLGELRRRSPLRLPRLSEAELPFGLLSRLGAQPREETVVYGVGIEEAAGGP